MTQRKHKASMKCKGCQKEFGIIQQAHIDKCLGLHALNIKTRAEYRNVFGKTMGSEQVMISENTIRSLNKRTSSKTKIKNACAGHAAADKKYGSISSIGGKKGSKVLWMLPNQKEDHRQRLIKLNQAGSMKQNPNKLEHKFWDMIGNSIEFCSFTFWKTVTTDRGISHITPDFRVPHTNLVIEVFGNYWHEGEDPINRINLWKSVGIECLVIWEREINSDKELVIAKVNKFISQNLQERGTPESESSG